MFQKILFKISNFLGKLYGKFNVAFNETYSDKETGERAVSEIERRKEENKEEFISQLATLAMLHAYKQDKRMLNVKFARKYAEYVFNREKEKGNIDELNRPIGEEDE